MLLETWTSYRNRISWIGENCGCLEEGKNLRFVVVEKTEHDYSSWNIALHNCLQLFFKTRYVPETAARRSRPHGRRSPGKTSPRMM